MIRSSHAALPAGLRQFAGRLWAAQQVQARWLSRAESRLARAIRLGGLWR